MEERVRVEGLWEGYRPKLRRRTGVRRREFRWALRDVTLEVSAGETLGIIGPNGAGKTTLLQCIAGVLLPDRGRVVRRGRTTSLVELSAGISRDLTGRENILVGGVLLGMSRAEARRRHGDIVEFSGLTPEVLQAPIFTYSAGMALRLAFSLVVGARPDILLVDEVLAVGDEAFQSKCVARVEDIKLGGGSIVIVSHDLSLVRERCDRVALLDGGALVFVGAPDAAIERYHEVTAGRARVVQAPKDLGQSSPGRSVHPDSGKMSVTSVPGASDREA